MSKHLLLVISFLFLYQETALAQTEESGANRVLEEIFVTARKKEESIHDVPMSITAVSGAHLEQMNIVSLEELQFALPNLVIVSNGINGQRTYIRGQGSETNQGFEQSVGWFVDGIYGGRSDQFKAPLFDVSSVELLRGPQGTILGKNTIAGAINVRTNRPTPEFEGYVSGLYEDEMDERKLEAVISGPITDTLNGRLALMDRENDGFIENLVNESNNSGFDMLDTQVARVSLEWDPNDTFSAYIKYENADADSDGVSAQIYSVDPNPAFDGTRAIVDGLVAAGQEDGVLNRSQGSLTVCETALAAITVHACGIVPDRSFRDIETDNAVLELTFQLGEYELVSVTGWSEFESEIVRDTDHSARSPITTYNTEDFDQFSQELRIASPGNQTIDWTAGLYYQDNTADTTINSILGSTLGGTAPGLVLFETLFVQDSETFSAFGEATWNVSDIDRITFGLRYTDETKDVVRHQSLFSAATGLPLTTAALGVFDVAIGAGYVRGPNPDNNPDHVNTFIEDYNDDHTTLQLVYQHDWNEHMLYAQVGEGYKAGGFNNLTRYRIIETFLYDPEEALAYEIGGKFLLADGTVNVNVAIFYTEYSDLQVSSFDGFSFNVTNAAESISQGIELDFVWQASEHWRLGGALAYLDSEFDKFPDTACPTGSPAGCLQDLSGEDTPRSPEFNGNLYAIFETPVFDNLLFTSRLDLFYTDEYQSQTDNDPQDLVPSYHRVDLRLALGSQADTWEVAIISRNLTDEEDYIHSVDVPLFAGAHGAVLLPPRTVALQGTWRFR